MNQEFAAWAPAGPEAQYTHTHDPWLSALEFVAHHHGRSLSRTDILQSLPVTGGRLDAQLFVRAASRAGLNAKIISRKPSAVSGLVCPYIVPMRNGDVAVATAKSRAGTRIVFPDTPHVLTLTSEDLDRHAMGVVILVAAVASGDADKHLNAQVERRHWLGSIVASYWPSWIYVLAAALLINMLALALPLFVMNVYDRVIPNNSIPTLWALAIGVLLALGFDFMLRMLRSIVIDHTGRRIDMQVSAALFEQAMDARLTGRPGSSGEIASHIREFESIRDFFTSSGIMSAIDLLFIGIFLLVLWLLVGPLMLVALIAAPIVLLFTLAIQIPLARNVEKAQRTIANRHGLLVEALGSLETVKAHSVEGAMQRRWERAVAGSVRASSSIRFWSSLATYFAMLVQQGVSVAILVWGVFLVAAGEITIGALIASNILAGRVLAPLGGIAMTLSRAQQSLAALRQINHLMSLERDHVPPAGDAGQVRTGRLHLRDICFAYPGQGVNALDGITLRIAPGERVGIVGRVGSGKSTLGRILCGLYRPDSGVAMLDDAEIRHYHIAELRRAVIYCGQQAELFSGTIRDNILMGHPEREADFERCASAAGVAAFAQAHPLGYAMPVGERGNALSGGQRQAVALARAMIAKPCILFLDEPTAAMDNLSETMVIRGLRRWLPDDLTLIVATHRASLLELVNRLIVLENGKVIADGPKDKVLAGLKRRKLLSNESKGQVAHGS